MGWFTILLRGTRGVGKTTTAEAFAEKLRVPLYKISAGGYNDLKDFKKRLSTGFEKAKIWKAVILVRQAELLFEHHSKDDMKDSVRKEIFLRVLDHFRGTIFLSSNRFEKLDSTFESCIDF